VKGESGEEEPTTVDSQLATTSLLDQSPDTAAAAETASVATAMASVAMTVNFIHRWAKRSPAPEFRAPDPCFDVAADGEL